MAETKNSSQSKKEKRRRQTNILLSLRVILFLVLISCLSANKLRTLDTISELSLVIERDEAGTQQLINDEVTYAPSEVKVNGNIKSCSKTCDLDAGTSNVIIKFPPEKENCQHMFKLITNIKKIDLSNFDFSKVNNMYGMFFKCSDLEEVKFGTKAPKPSNAGVLFQGCIKLTSVDLSNFDFSLFNDFYGMFLDCNNIEIIKFGNIPSVSNFGVAFQNCLKLETIDLSTINLSGTSNMLNMFYGCPKLKNVNFGSSATTSLNNMQGMFFGCSSLESVDLSNFVFTQVTTMQETFSGCSSLKNVNFGTSATSSLKNMQGLFFHCSSLESMDLSSFIFSSVQTMQEMFSGCSNLKNVTFGNSVASSLSNLQGLFYQCSNLESIDLSNFQTTSVTTMESMFNGCSKIKYLNLSNFKTSSISTLSHMFNGGVSLRYLNLYHFTVNNGINYENIFGGLKPDVIYCIFQESTKNLLLGSDKISFCSDECYTMINYKIDIIQGKCIESCQTTENKYEVNNKCYSFCPSGTLFIGDFKCLVKDCSSDEFTENHIECKDGEPIGFYVDQIDGVYKKCYETCDFCDGVGSESNHNCNECKSGFRFLNDSVNMKIVMKIVIIIIILMKVIHISVLEVEHVQVHLIN